MILVQFALLILCSTQFEGAYSCKCNGRNIVAGPFGGTSGTPFTDSRFTTYGYPTQVQIWAGGIIDAIQVRYGATEAPKHGGDGGTLHTVNLESGELITAINGTYGNQWGNTFVVCQLTITTNNGRSFGPYCGVQCDTPFNSINPGCNFSFVSGRSGQFLVSLLFHWCCIW
eukprot:GFUD01121662.1.p1 GENE.GFUD01121662.1~~GFUD01121662.1.p1  ORF type:complete len:171 (-),score=6.46 GFUD01121662.1:77-589(-)